MTWSTRRELSAFGWRALGFIAAAIAALGLAGLGTFLALHEDGGDRAAVGPARLAAPPQGGDVQKSPPQGGQQPAPGPPGAKEDEPAEVPVNPDSPSGGAPPTPTPPEQKPPVVQLPDLGDVGVCVEGVVCTGR